MKAPLLLSLSLILQLSCGTKPEKIIFVQGEVQLIEKLQSNCYFRYQKSDYESSDLLVIKEDRTEAALGEIAAKHVLIADSLDKKIFKLFNRIHHLESNLIRSNISSNKPKKPIGLSDVVWNEPAVLNMESLNFISRDKYLENYDESLSSLKSKIEELRRLFIQLELEFYGMDKFDGVEMYQLAKTKEFFKDEFKQKEKAFKVSLRYGCSQGERNRISEINLLLSFNDEKWQKQFQSKKDVFLTMSNLVLLQNDLIEVRIKIFELMKDNLDCERLKLKNKSRN